MSSATSEAVARGRFDSNSSVVVLGGVAVALGSVTTLLLARLLGTDEFGRYALFVAAIRFLVLPTEAGLPQLVTREMNRGDGKRTIAWSKRLLGLSWVIITTGVFLVEHFLRSGITSQTWLVSIAVGALGLLYLCRGILLGEQQTLAALAPDSVWRPAVLVVLVLIFSATVGLDAESAQLAFMLSVGFALGLALIFARRHFLGSKDNRPVRLRDGQLFKALVPLTLIKGVRLINRRVEILVLGAFALTSEVGVYNVALQLTGLVLLAQTMVNARLSPHVARASRHSPEDLPDMVGGAVRISVAFATAAFVGMAILGRPVLSLLGDDFNASYKLVLLLGAANVLSAAFGPTTMLLNMGDFAEDSFRSGLAAAVANVALMFVLIPSFGATGAAVSAASVTVLIQLQRWVLVHRRLGIRPDVIAALRS